MDSSGCRLISTCRSQTRLFVGLMLLVYLFLGAVAPVEAGEVLPPWSYLNRTVYPPIINYTRKPHLAVGLISDVQYAEIEEFKRRHFKLSRGKLDQAIAEMNANRTHLDFVLHLGDLVDHDMAKYLPILKPILAKLKYPLYHVLGNHDFLGTAESKFSTIHQQLGMPSRYYSFLAGPSHFRYRFIVLDGNDLSLYSTISGSPERKEAEAIYWSLKKRKAKNAQKFNGAIGGKQLEWLKAQLNETCSTPGGQRAVIVLHHPMRPKNEPTNLWNDLVVVPIVSSYHCVVAVINGHAHRYIYDYHHYVKQGSNDRYPDHQIHFITFGGMVQSPFTSYGFADFYDNDLHIHGLIFGRAISEHYPVNPLTGSAARNAEWIGSQSTAGGGDSAAGVPAGPEVEGRNSGMDTQTTLQVAVDGGEGTIGIVESGAAATASPTFSNTNPAIVLLGTGTQQQSPLGDGGPGGGGGPSGKGKMKRASPFGGDRTFSNGKGGLKGPGSSPNPPLAPWSASGSATFPVGFEVLGLVLFLAVGLGWFVYRNRFLGRHRP